jgi:hypothetical protein
MATTIPAERLSERTDDLTQFQRHYDLPDSERAAQQQGDQALLCGLEELIRVRVPTFQGAPVPASMAAAMGLTAPRRKTLRDVPEASIRAAISAVAQHPQFGRGWTLGGDPRGDVLARLDEHFAALHEAAIAWRVLSAADQARRVAELQEVDLEALRKNAEAERRRWAPLVEQSASREWIPVTTDEEEHEPAWEAEEELAPVLGGDGRPVPLRS